MRNDSSQNPPQGPTQHMYISTAANLQKTERKMNKPGYSEHIPSLDLCRGLAAVCVLLLHMDFMFFGIENKSYKMFPRGYLCVDFFFLLSGYVIANSYDWKFSEGLKAKTFVGIRIARLWPLVVLTCFTGFTLVLIRSHSLSGGFDPDSMAFLSLVLNLAMIPAFVGIAVFPFNPAAWSIFFEFAVNVLYGVLNRHMSNTLIFLMVALGLVGLANSIRVENTLDVGWSTSNITLAWPRVIYSFFLGVAIFRFRENFRISLPSYVLVAVLAVTAIMMHVPIDEGRAWSGYYDIVVAVLVLPMLLIVAVGTRLPSWADSLALFLGGISYSVYLWHTPMLIAYSAALKRIPGHVFDDFVPWAGVIFVSLIIIQSYLTWRFFERPAQKFLRNKFASLESKKSVA